VSLGHRSTRLSVPTAALTLTVLILIEPLGCRRPQSESRASTTTSAIAGRRAPAAALRTPTAAPSPVILGSGSMPLSFAELVKRAQPAVCTIKASSRRENAFGRKVTVAEGVGTGFVYDPEGYALTNNHVIDGATEIITGFANGQELPATIVGQDKPTDIAVIKIASKTPLPALPLGDADAIQVGDWVVAIGNPFGLAHTVSAGILSGKGRTRDDVQGLDPSGYFNFLQTDASINPGNSGGPLLNLAGQAVGINAAVRANANNIGFAIPMNMVLQLLPMLLKDGKVSRSAIGIYVDPVSEADRSRLNLPNRKGAVVTKVLAGKAADRAGLARGDVILAFNDAAVEDPNELRWLASIAGVNKTVSLRVARGDRIFNMKVTLLELSEP